jgi:hypothetical protein
LQKTHYHVAIFGEFRSFPTQRALQIFWGVIGIVLNKFMPSLSQKKMQHGIAKYFDGQSYKNCDYSQQLYHDFSKCNKFLWRNSCRQVARFDFYALK